MSYFNSWRFHRDLGFAYGLTLRSASTTATVDAIYRLDRWAFQREWDQNLRGKTPNPVLGQHQTREAAAWGYGARKSAGVNPPYPSPPYPEGYEWTG